MTLGDVKIQTYQPAHQERGDAKVMDKVVKLIAWMPHLIRHIAKRSGEMEDKRWK